MRQVFVTTDKYAWLVRVFVTVSVCLGVLGVELNCLHLEYRHGLTVCGMSIGRVIVSIAGK